MRYARIACVVPFCGRGTTRFPDGEIICGKHYALVDRDLKRRRAKWRAVYRRNGQADTVRADRVDALMWRWIKQQAIERAAGA